MLAVQTLLTVTILVLFFVKFRIGLCVYIAYIFLVPYCSINIGGLSLGWNLMNTALLLAYCINCNRKFGKIQFSYKPFIPFFILYGLLLMEMPFQDGVPMEFAIDKWRLDVFNLILPIVVFSTSQYDNKIGKHSLVTMVLVCIVVIVYAFILIPLQGLNPYIMELANINNAELLELFLVWQLCTFILILVTIKMLFYCASWLVCFHVSFSVASALRLQLYLSPLQSICYRKKTSRHSFMLQ